MVGRSSKKGLSRSWGHDCWAKSAPQRRESSRKDWLATESMVATQLATVKQQLRAADLPPDRTSFGMRIIAPFQAFSSLSLDSEVEISGLGDQQPGLGHHGSCGSPAAQQGQKTLAQGSTRKKKRPVEDELPPIVIGVFVSSRNHRSLVFVDGFSTTRVLLLFGSESISLAPLTIACGARSFSPGSPGLPPEEYSTR